MSSTLKFQLEKRLDIVERKLSTLDPAVIDEQIVELKKAAGSLPSGSVAARTLEREAKKLAKSKKGRPPQKQLDHYTREKKLLESYLAHVEGHDDFRKRRRRKG